jgi:hypothetical protein
MTRWRLFLQVAPALLSASLWTGVVTADEPGRASAPPAAKDEHGHEHPSEGPHHGDLVELGKEEYHAEIVHGKEGQITIYLLDHEARKTVPTEAKQVLINLVHQGKAEQYKLLAVPDKGDPAGKTSRFSLTDKHLAEDLDADGCMAKLVITINGKQYTGKIAHDHDHADHKH